MIFPSIFFLSSNSSFPKRGSWQFSTVCSCVWIIEVSSNEDVNSPLWVHTPNRFVWIRQCFNWDWTRILMMATNWVKEVHGILSSLIPLGNSDRHGKSHSRAHPQLKLNYNAKYTPLHNTPLKHGKPYSAWSNVNSFIFRNSYKNNYVTIVYISIISRMSLKYDKFESMFWQSCMKKNT